MNGESQERDDDDDDDDDDNSDDIIVAIDALKEKVLGQLSKDCQAQGILDCPFFYVLLDCICYSNWGKVCVCVCVFVCNVMWVGACALFLWV
jgi:hypothetical protein